MDLYPGVKAWTKPSTMESELGIIHEIGCDSHQGESYRDKGQDPALDHDVNTPLRRDSGRKTTHNDEPVP